jgi:hypothetical protein
MQGSEFIVGLLSKARHIGLVVHYQVGDKLITVPHSFAAEAAPTDGGVLEVEADDYITEVYCTSAR